MAFEEVLHAIGEFGPYQWRTYLMLCLMVAPSTWCTLIRVFAMRNTGHWCEVPSWNQTVCTDLGLDTDSCDLGIKKLINIPLDNSKNDSDLAFKKCTRYNISDYSTLSVVVNDSSSFGYSLLVEDESREEVPCDAGWDYDRSQYTRTLVQELDLVCGDEKYIQIPQSFYYCGYLVGSGVFGALGDRYGRYPILFATIGLRIIAGYVLAIVRNYWAFAFIRFLQGCGQMGTYMLAFVIGTEFVGVSKRNVSGIVINIPYAVGYMVYAGIAFLIRDWRILEVVITTPLFLFFILMFFLSESPRWLLSQGKTEKAKKIIRHAAKVNKVELPEELLEENVAGEEKKGEDEESKRQPNATDLFRHPRLRRRIFILMYCWGVCAVVYHGLNLSTSTLGINIYISFFVSAAIEIPAYLVALFAIESPRFGRRLTLVMTFLVAGVTCLVTIFIAPGPVRASVAMIGKFGISTGFSVIYLFTIEIMPTIIRSVGLGVCSMAGRIANILAPVVLMLGVYWKPAPLVVFGSATLLAGFLSFLLPETMGRKLPETVQDGENFGSRPPKEEIQVDDLTPESGKMDTPKKEYELPHEEII